MSTQFNCCSSVTKCKQGQGDCDYDNDCESGMFAQVVFFFLKIDL